MLRASNEVMNFSESPDWKSSDHRSLLNSEYRGWFQYYRRAYSERLIDKRPFTKKIMRTRHRQHSFLPCSRDHGDLNSSALNEVDGIGRIALRIDLFTFPKE